MAFQMNPHLPPTPPTFIDPQGEPRIGAYQGSAKTIDLRPRLGGGITGRVKQLLKMKRWTWGGIMTQDVVIGFAIVDAGFAGNAFAFVVDLKEGRLISDRSFLGAPGAVRLADRPGDGFSARMFTPGATLKLHRPKGSPSFHVELKSGDLHVDALLDTAAAPEPLAVLMPLIGGDLNFTQKTTLMPSAGTLSVGGKTWSLSGGFGGLDFTHGVFARRTAWRWAFAMGKDNEGIPVSLNLTDGLCALPGNENALWLGRTIVPVQSPTFIFDSVNHSKEWRVHTPDGAVDLTFTPSGIHREDRDLKLIQAHFSQVAGTFRGTLRDIGGRVHRVDALPGVTEDQRVLW